jgi:hypothetical protein
MMPAGKMAGMVVKNTLRSPRHFLLSVFGIVFGIGAFVFFLSLASRASEVLQRIFPIEQVQVVAPRMLLAGKDLSKPLDDNTVKALVGHPNVADATPRMALKFEAAGAGSFEGNALNFEVGGFADGIDEKFVHGKDPSKEPPWVPLFKDWEAEPPGPACLLTAEAKRERRKAIQKAAAAKKAAEEAARKGLPPGASPPPGPKPPAPAPKPPAPAPTPPAPAPAPAAGSGSAAAPGAGSAAPPAGAPVPPVPPVFDPSDLSVPFPQPTGAYKDAGGWWNDCPQPEWNYCDELDNRCRHRVPVVVSPTLLEIYSGQFAPSHNMPQIDGATAQAFVDMRGPGKMSFEIILGATALAGVKESIPEEKRRTVEAVLIGVSPKAMPIGMTIPIEYIARWNREYIDDKAASTYSSIIVTLKDPKQLAVFAQWLKDEHDLRIEDSLGERFSTVIFVIAVLFTIISILIITISAINIAHNFFMQVAERRREIGVMRAVGATRNDVLLLILGEAALIGLAGGVLGVALALGAGSLIDWLAQAAPNFPFKPDSWFSYKPWILGGGIGLSTLFCVLGGYLPARRASKMEPAAALAQN